MNKTLCIYGKNWYTATLIFVFSLTGKPPLSCHLLVRGLKYIISLHIWKCSPNKRSTSHVLLHKICPPFIVCCVVTGRPIVYLNPINCLKLLVLKTSMKAASFDDFVCTKYLTTFWLIYILCTPKWDHIYYTDRK